jgi:hypothetical protein
MHHKILSNFWLETNVISKTNELLNTELQRFKFQSTYILQELADRLNMQYIETSAKDATNVNKAFERLGLSVMKYNLGQGQTPAPK